MLPSMSNCGQQPGRPCSILDMSIVEVGVSVVSLSRCDDLAGEVVTYVTSMRVRGGVLGEEPIDIGTEATDGWHCTLCSAADAASCREWNIDTGEGVDGNLVRFGFDCRLCLRSKATCFPCRRVVPITVIPAGYGNFESSGSIVSSMWSETGEEGDLPLLCACFDVTFDLVAMDRSKSFTFQLSNCSTSDCDPSLPMLER